MALEPMNRGHLRFALLVLALLVAGCGPGNRAPVKGKVVFNGQPVTEGAILLAPIGETGESGAPANGIVQLDGTFSLGTDKDADGAAIGRHRVYYTAPSPTGPAWDGYGPEPERKYSRFQGLSPREAEVEVKAGSNELTIELVAPP